MPTKKDKLSWFPPRRQWRKRKKINGKVRTWYLGRSNINKTDRAAYDDAMVEWERIAAALEAEQAAAIQQVHQQPAEQIAADLSAAQAELAQAVAAGDNLDRELAQIRTVGERAGVVAVHEVGDDADAPKGISEIIGQFYIHSEVLVAAGERSQRRHNDLKWQLEKFKSWANCQEGADLNATTLNDWHLHLMHQVAAKKMSAKYAADQLTATKQLIRYCWQNEIIENLPRNLESLRIRVPTSKVEAAQPEAIRRLIAAADGRLRLYLSLAALCGMQAADLADLRHHEVNLKAGKITRQRTKTRHHGDNVPTVTYTLPKPVAKLLRQLVTSGEDDEQVFRTSAGRPLVHGRTDSVRLALEKLRNRLNKEAKAKAEKCKQKGGKKATPDLISISMKTMRSTGATLIAHKHDEALADYWAAHAPKGIGQKHYIAPNQKRLDAAVAYLAQTYGLTQDQAVQRKAKKFKKKKAATKRTTNTKKTTKK